MGNENRRLMAAIRSALGATVLLAGAAFAADDVDDTAAKLDKVEVTGSRIKRVQIEGAMPVTTVTREDIERTGLQSLGDILQELPAAGPALNTNFNNGGDGSTQLDLRNLGAQRLLVLVNGHRWVSHVGGNNFVDLNTIPLAIVERVEVLKDGASAVYGSDAIAGVVNIITRDDFEGASANAMVGEYEQGDGRQVTSDFSIGSTSTRSSALLTASYYKAEAVWAGDRRISQEPLFGGGTNFGSSTMPDGRFRFDANTAGNGLPCTTLAIPTFWCGAGGVFGATHIGPPTGTGTQPMTNPSDATQFAALTDFYNYAPTNYLSTPSERWAIYAQGRYDITDNVAFTTEALYNNRVSEQLLAPHPLVLTGNGAARADGQFIPIDATNPYNPFGVTIVDTSQVGAFVPGGTLGARNLQRRLTETGGRSFNQYNETFLFAAGLEGTLTLADRVWDWNLMTVFGEGREIDIAYGHQATTRIRTALGPVAACISPCVPLNLFGGVGSITPEMLDFIDYNQHDNSGDTLHDYALNASGELFDLPAGAVGIAVGVEHRATSGYIDPDAFLASGNNTGNNFQPLSGRQSVDEIYAEFAVPILRDAPFAETLELSLAVRASDYSDFGRTTNSKFGIRWQPFTDLLVRGTYQTGFRAPTVFELFVNQVEDFPQLADPCSVGPVNGGSGTSGLLDPTPDNAAEEQLYANCTGAPSPNTSGTGVATTTLTSAPGQNLFVPVALSPAAFYGQASDQIRVLVGGNPNLQPETSTSTTFGLVYSPSYVNGLSLTLDWYDIELQDAIQDANAAFTLQNCYESGVQAYCNQLTRFVTGDLDYLPALIGNVSTFAVSGIDLNIVFRIGELPLLPGEWKLGWDTTWVDAYEYCNSGVCRDYVGFNTGDSSLPAFKSNLDVDWTWGDWEATWRMRFIGAQSENCTTSGVPLTLYGPPCSNVISSSAATNHLGATTYHNVQLSYTINEWDTRVTFGVNNLFGKEPPISVMAFANSFDPTTYEVPGRFVYLRLSSSF